MDHERYPHYFSDAPDQGMLIRAAHPEHARESFLAVASGLIAAMRRLVTLPIHR